LVVAVMVVAVGVAAMLHAASCQVIDPCFLCLCDQIDNKNRKWEMHCLSPGTQKIQRP
jgi:hypothetical protein